MRRTLLVMAALAVLVGLGGMGSVGSDPPCATVEEGGQVYVNPPDCVPDDEQQQNGSGSGSGG